MKKVKVFDINWCIEKEDIDYISEEDYPSYDIYREAVRNEIAEIKSELPSEILLDVEDFDDLEYEIEEAISNRFGWLVYSFDYRFV